MDSKRHFFERPIVFFALALSLLVARSAAALEVEINDGSNSIVIVDDAAGDNNLVDTKVIDFDITSDPTIPDLDGGGRVRQTQTPLGQMLTLSATPPNLTTTLKNVGASPLTITVTIRSDDPYPAAIGPPLGWRLFFNGEVADTSGSADIVDYSASLSTDNDVTPRVVEPIADASDLLGGPLLFESPAIPGSAPLDSVTSSQMSATFTIGAGDELRLADNEELDAIGLQGNVFNHDGKCIFLMNKGAANVAKAEQRGDTNCVKDLASSGGNATTCVDGEDASGETAEGKQLDQFVAFDCDPPAAWGINAASCCDGGANDGEPCGSPLDCGGEDCTAGACIGGAAQSAANDLIHDVFGSSVTVGTDPVGVCQAKLLGQLGKALGNAWKKFAQCKRKNFSSIANDTDLATTCFSAPNEALDLVFAKVELKVQSQADKCEASGATPVADQFPGRCDGETTTADFADCVTERARCRLCQAVQVADDVDPGAVNCDLFDDTTANASCSDIAGATTTTTSTSTTTEATTTTTM
jgi:hypothetical protein